MCPLPGPWISVGDERPRPSGSTPCSLRPNLVTVTFLTGRRTIREILAAAAQSTTASGRSPANLERFAHVLFESLVNRDFLVLTLRH